MAKKKQKQRPKISVADYISHQIAIRGKSQKDIAADVGYDKPNMVTMIKQGKTKLPLNKVSLFAKSLGVDPIHLLRIAMEEYQPETLDAISKIIGQAIISENEMRIINIIRDITGGVDVAPKNNEDREELSQLIGKWRDRNVGLVNAA